MKTFQEIVAKLSEFWAKQGCLILQPYDIEKGAGTFNPATFLRCLGPEPIMAAYIEPCRRPKDGRYGTNPNRLQHYFQYQVILKPSPYNIQDLYLQSLEAIGLNLSKHDIRFVHDDWESPTLGAWGLGWEVWIDGQESSQFTYFQSVAGIPLSPITGEITYGIERIAMYLQNVDSIFDIKWNDAYTYGDLYKRNEVEWSEYNFEKMDAKMWFKHFEEYEKEAKRLVSLKLPLPAYDFVIKSSHAFNMLDARGVISVSERANYIANIRNLARQVADCYIESRKEQGYPLMNRIHPQMHIPQHEKAKAFKESDHDEDFLLEIGCEELPASFVLPGLESLKRRLQAVLDTEKISYKEILVMGTPRRLAIMVHKVSSGRKAHCVEKKGPSIEHAFKDGALLPAGLGFFRSLGKEPLSLADIKKGKDPEIQLREIKNSEYLFAVQQVDEVKTWKLLQQKLPDLILGIDFPKKMRWADLDISFARPIRWIVSLLGKEVIPFEIGPIHASNISYGHRQLSPNAFSISSASSYKAELKEHHVLVDLQERKTHIEQELQQIEKKMSCKAVRKEKVTAEVLQLVEWPFLTETEFNKEFLKAPKEVLISEMVEHQKYFPLEDAHGKLHNMFIITANTKPTESIRHGNRKVISARLSDGVFLYEQDLKTPLEQFNEKLKGIVFQKGLGTMYDKVERIKKHAELLSHIVPGATKEHVALAAHLSKADLATEMVGEFPELQGTMGRIYAEKQGKPKEVAQAIDEQWMPKGEGASLPETPTGIVLSLSDKIDNLIGFFGLDLKPTSSSDPFALRRQALGLVRILIAHKLPISLKDALYNHTKAFSQEFQAKKDLIIRDIISFLQMRARSVLQDFGFLKGEIDACIDETSDDMYDIFCKLQALQTFRKEDASFHKLIEVHKRCKGQIQGMKTADFDASLLQQDEEKKLYRLLKEQQAPFEQAIKSRNYLQALHLLAQLQDPLAHLFDKVKILADDERIKTNRLALLQHVANRFHEVADFQKIQETK